MVHPLRPVTPLVVSVMPIPQFAICDNCTLGTEENYIYICA
jgi:hypothetical protein